MLKFKAMLAVKPGAQPSTAYPYSVPFALREALDRLEAARVMKKVTKSDWAAPILAILKSDGSLRICTQIPRCRCLSIGKPEDLMVSLTRRDEIHEG